MQQNPLTVTIQSVLGHCHMSPGGQKCPRLRTTDIACHDEGGDLVSEQRDFVGSSTSRSNFPRVKQKQDVETDIFFFKH